jgi:TolB protein
MKAVTTLKKIKKNASLVGILVAGALSLGAILSLSAAAGFRPILPSGSQDSAQSGPASTDRAVGPLPPSSGMSAIGETPSPGQTVGKPRTGRGTPLGVFEAHGDIGLVEKPGSVIYEPEIQTYLIEGAGANMWFDADEGHFLWKRITGDFIVSAKVQFVGTGGAPHRKIGWMARSSLAPDSAQASTVVHGDGTTALQFRKTRGGFTAEDQIGVTGPNQIQLERRGDTYIMSVAAFGEPYFRDQVDGIALGDDVYVGLFVCSHNANVIEKALFSNVRIVIPAKDGFVPYRDYLSSRLEILDVGTKNRTVVFESPRPLQAPNWTKDERALIYNCEGLLYRFDLASGRPTLIDTGFARAVNNDHVLSPNGKTLGISHDLTSAGGASIIYTLPMAGGRPSRVTPKGPSYLHGWSPDGKNLVYTGLRNGNYDVYRISARGGTKETRLTRSKGLDDGPEYTADGRFIYFNSNRTGTMEIWRMLFNGKAERQVTRDALQDWFPHVSPDGRWVVFLSYESDVGPDDHPFYKQVYVRIMPVGGGYESRIIAYVYGGQGTINVPSWSSDSQRIAFISYTGEMR